jgi:hypothetical protein
MEIVSAIAEIREYTCDIHLRSLLFFFVDTDVYSGCNMRSYPEASSIASP